jgi:hypothetical protein
MQECLDFSFRSLVETREEGIPRSIHGMEISTQEPQHLGAEQQASFQIL